MKLSTCLVGLTFLCVACGDDDSSAKPGLNEDGGATTRSDGAVTGTDRDAATGGNADAGACSPSGNNLPGTCTEAEYATYSKCLLSACDSHYKKCNGPDYKKGDFAGLCGKYLECVSACGCDPSLSCITACGEPSDECATCLEDDSCADSCGAEPACATSSGGGKGDAGTGATCADLKACCESLADAADKSDCLGVLANAQMIPSAADQFCAVSLMSYQSVGDCK